MLRRRKTLLLILIAVLSFGAMSFGLVTSGAWFTDSAAASGAILISGSLDLHVTGGPLRANDLEPSQEYTLLGEFCNENTGSTPLKYRGRFESPQPISHDLLKYLNMRVERRENGWELLQEILGNPPVETEGLPFYFKTPEQDPGVQIHHVVSGSLTPGGRDCYRLSVRLDPDTPDEIQGKSVQFFLHLEATQPENPGWE